MPSCSPELAEDGVGKMVPRTVPLVADVPEIQKLLDVHNGTHHPRQFLDLVRKAMSIFGYVSRHTPHASSCVKTCSKRAHTKLCPSFAFVFHLCFPSLQAA